MDAAPDSHTTALISRLQQEVERLTDEGDVRALVDSLFTLTDLKDWQAATALYVDEPIVVDMTSLVGGAPSTMPASELFAGFEQGLFAESSVITWLATC